METSVFEQWRRGVPKLPMWSYGSRTILKPRTKSDMFLEKARQQRTPSREKDEQQQPSEVAQNEIDVKVDLECRSNHNHEIHYKNFDEDYIITIEPKKTYVPDVLFGNRRVRPDSYPTSFQRKKEVMGYLPVWRDKDLEHIPWTSQNEMKFRKP